MEKSMALYKGKGDLVTLDFTGGVFAYPTYPPVSSGDLLLLCISYKAYSYPDFTVPTGWTWNNLGINSAGVGTTGVDKGTVSAVIMYKIATGTETGSLQVEFGETVPSGQAVILAFSRPPDYYWDFVIDGHSSYSNYHVSVENGVQGYWHFDDTALAYSQLIEGDLFIVLSAINSDLFSFSNQNLYDISEGAVDIPLETELIDQGTNQGNDQSILISLHRCEVPNSLPNAELVYYATLNTTHTTTSPAGIIVLFMARVRPYGKLKRWTGAEWLWCPIEDFLSSVWIKLGMKTPNKILKRYNSTTSSFIPVSAFNFSINESDLTFAYNGAAQSKTITSNHQVDITKSDSWISLSTANLHGTGDVSIGVVEQVASAPAREGDVYFSIENIQYATVHINQDVGPTPIISLDYSNMTWDNNGDPCNSGILTVTSNCDWYIDPLTIPAWITLNIDEGPVGITPISITVGYGAETYKEEIMGFVSAIDDIERTTCSIRQLEGDCV